MKAAWFDSFGPASEVLRVGDFETPRPGHGEVLVRMHTSAVNPSDTKKRAGASPTLLDDGPVIPNSDGAGVIEEVGMGVPRSRIGQRVWVYQAQFARQHGTAAQYLAINDRIAAMEEPTVDDVDMNDPEQVKIWKTVQILLNKVIYAESYLQQ